MVPRIGADSASTNDIGGRRFLQAVEDSEGSPPGTTWFSALASTTDPVSPLSDRHTVVSDEAMILIVLTPGRGLRSVDQGPH